MPAAKCTAWHFAQNAALIFIILKRNAFAKTKNAAGHVAGARSNLRFLSQAAITPSLRH
jgi:hypothetical protein